MTPARFSLLLAGIIWLSVGFRIGSRAMGWLEPYFVEPNWMLSLLFVSLLIGVIKSSTVLKKACLRNIENVDKIDSNPLNYLKGFLILFGARGIITILLMIALGFLLRFLKEIGYDPYNIFGFIYMGIALALAFASRFYFSEFTKQK
ncbi:MAG: hypothetical protein HRT47_00350 [Candidatus Caenarcaniphilales bacterium]|nr:hypothetical protein [Candidatus Caenarcaniphilales bacterium]